MSSTPPRKDSWKDPEWDRRRPLPGGAGQVPSAWPSELEDLDMCVGVQVSENVRRFLSWEPIRFEGQG